MAKNRLTQSERRWLTGFFAVVFVLASLYLVYAFARSSSVVVTQPGVEHPPPSRIDLYVYSLNVETENNNLQVELFPVPRGAVGTALGLTGRASETFQLFVDGAEPPEETIEAGSVIERSDATIGVSDVTPIVNFPFDSYGGLIEASAKLKEPSPTGSSNIPVIIHPEPPGVPGYNMLFSSPRGFSASAALASGHWRTTISVTRDDDVRLITIMVGAVLVCSAAGFAGGVHGHHEWPAQGQHGHAGVDGYLPLCPDHHPCRDPGSAARRGRFRCGRVLLAGRCRFFGIDFDGDPLVGNPRSRVRRALSSLRALPPGPSLRGPPLQVPAVVPPGGAMDNWAIVTYPPPKEGPIRGVTNWPRQRASPFYLRTWRVPRRWAMRPPSRPQMTCAQLTSRR